MNLKSMVNILIVDDKPEGLISIQAVLNDPTYNIELAHSGQDALRRILEVDYALILLDVQMPIMDGFETATIIKSREKSKDIPIIFLSAISKDENFINQGYQVGAIDYLLKPLDVNILKSKVAAFVDIYRKNILIKEQAAQLAQQEKAEREKILIGLEVESLRRYRTLADAIPHIVWQADSSGTMNYFNKTWSQYTKLSQEQSIGSSWLNVIHEKDRDLLLTLWEEAKVMGHDFEIECRLRSYNGQLRWHLFKACPEKLKNADWISSWIGTFTDIHDRKEVSEKLRVAVQSRDDFLSIASHELKTPLSALSLRLQILSMDLQKALKRQAEENITGEPILVPGKIEKSLAVCVGQTQKIADLLDELMDITHIRLGKLKLSKNLVDLCEIARDLVSRIPSSSGLYNLVSLEIETAEAIGNWDPLRIEQVINNLLFNALKYGNGKPIKLKIARNDYTKEAVLSVADQGVGIPIEMQEKIFECFERVETQSYVGGLGLGLYITRQILAGHNGRIEVKSELDIGSTFIVNLPLEMENTKQQNVGVEEKLFL